MKIARKQFNYPASNRGEFVTEVTEGLFGRPSKREVWKEEVTRQDVLKNVEEFVDKLNPSQLVNICEYTKSLNRIGDDCVLVIVVWYWEMA